MTHEPETISDADLSAFLDGELDRADAARVRAALEDGGETAARLAAFRAVDDRLRAAFSAAPDLPGARATLARRRPAHAGGWRGTLKRFLARPAFSPAYWAAPGAAVAALAVAAAMLAAPRSEFASEFAFPGGAAAPKRSVLAALSETPGGGALEADGARIIPVVSFRDGDGAFCREIEIASGERARAVFCRRGGDWRLAAAAGVPAVDPDAFVAADAGLEAYEEDVARLMAGEPLSPEDERAAIDDGWENDPR